MAMSPANSMGERPEPVRLYAEEDHRLPARLAGSLKEQIAQKVEALSSGYALNFPEYRERVGELAGLRLALGICEQIEKQLSEH